MSTRTPSSARGPQAARPAPAARAILARLDRIDAWSMPFLFIGIIGAGFLFAFYDVFDINVSFIQSCVALKPGARPLTRSPRCAYRWCSIWLVTSSARSPWRRSRTGSAGATC